MNAHKWLLAGIFFAAVPVAQADPIPCPDSFCDVTTASGQRIIVEARSPGAFADPNEARPSPEKFVFVTPPGGGGFLIPLNGMLNRWEVNGINRMFSESAFLRVNGTGPAPWGNDLIGAGLAGTTNLIANNSIGVIQVAPTEPTFPGINFSATYALQPGFGNIVKSNIRETMTVVNNTAASVQLDLFLYTDADLTPGDPFQHDARIRAEGSGSSLAIVQKSLHGNGAPLTSLRVQNIQAFVEDVAGSAVSTRFEIGTFSGLGASLLNPGAFGPFAGDLSDSPPVSQGPRDFVSILQWKYDLAPGQTAKVILDKTLLIEVPEPATLSLLALAIAGLGFSRRRRLH